MSSAGTENASQEEVLSTPEVASPEPTVPLVVFQQLQARLEQLEVASERSRWSDGPDHEGSESIHPRRRKNLPDINHDAQCKTWKRWFSAKQGINQDVRAFNDYLDTIVKDLHDPPGDAGFYYKLRTGIQPSIQEVLDVQIIQPANCEDLLSLALRIEKNGKTTPRRDQIPFQPPPNSQSLSQGRRPSQPRPSPKHQGRNLNEGAQKGNRVNTKATNRGQSRGSDIPRGPRGDHGGHMRTQKDDRGQQPIHGTQNGQKPLVDRAEKLRRAENNLCFDCGEPDHRPKLCKTPWNKPADGWDSKPTDGWESQSTDGWVNKSADGLDNKPSDGWVSTPSDEWACIPSNGWTTWENTLQPIERFQSQKKEGIQSTGLDCREGTRSPQQGNLNQSRWSTNGSADVTSLLD